MITGQITNLDLDPAEIEMTTWEIADSKDFANIIASSVNDRVNITSIVFEDADVEYGKEYYGRATIFIRNRGWNIVNNISIIAKEREDNVTIKNHLPSIIGAPAINIRYDGKDIILNESPSTDLEFVIEPNGVVGLGEINKYSLYLLNANGDVIWRRIETEEKVHKLSDLVLSSKVYTLKACCHCTTNEVSEFASVTFIVTETSSTNLSVYLTNFFSKTLDVTRPIELHFPFDYDITTIDFSMSTTDGTVSDIVAAGQLTKENPILTIRENTLVKGKTYKIQALTNKYSTFLNVKIK